MTSIEHWDLWPVYKHRVKDRAPEYSQQPEQLRREPMVHTCAEGFVWDRWSGSKGQCVPEPFHNETADTLYRHQPDPAEQASIHTMRTFDTGATRDSAENKPDYKGYLSPLALRHFGRYMLKHQKQADGTMRKSDNWKKGIPEEEYAKSLIRHVVDFWLARELSNQADEEEALDAILFNTFGILHEREKSRLLNFGHSMNDLAEGSLMGGGLK